MNQFNEGSCWQVPNRFGDREPSWFRVIEVLTTHSTIDQIFHIREGRVGRWHGVDLTTQDTSGAFPLSTEKFELMWILAGSWASSE